MTEQDRLDMESDVLALLAATPRDGQATVHLSTGSVILTARELADRYWKLQAFLSRSR